MADVNGKDIYRVSRGVPVGPFFLVFGCRNEKNGVLGDALAKIELLSEIGQSYPGDGFTEQ
jgi:hypothetical protein